MCTSINKEAENQIGTTQDKYKNKWCDEAFNEVVKAKTEVRMKWLRTKNDEHKILYQEKRKERDGKREVGGE